MVTHEARAAAIADRILFLADGLIVKELSDAEQGEVLEVMSTLRHDEGRAQGTARAASPARS